MKKFFSILALVCAAVILVPCNVYAANPNGKKQKPDKVEKFAKKRPELRVAASGEHFNESSATNIAELNARAAFARKIETAVYASTESYTHFKSQQASNNNSSAAMFENTTEQKEVNTMISSQILRNVHVVKKQAYYNEDTRLWKVNVCIEFKGTPEQMFTGFAEVLQKQLPAEEKASLEIHQETMREVFISKMKTE